MPVVKYKTVMGDNKEPVLVKVAEYQYSTTTESPGKVSIMMNLLFGLNHETEEYLYEICLTAKCKPLGIFELSHGTAVGSLCNPREIFQKALLSGAVGVIIVHNHPSGDPEPSKEDVGSFERLKQAGDLIGVTVLDSIIVGDDTGYSLSSKDYFEL